MEHSCNFCKHFNYEEATFDCPYPSVWCGKGIYDGVDDYSDLTEENCCDKWEGKE